MVGVSISRYRTSVSYPNGSSEVYQYDSLNRLSRKETYNGAGALVQAYDYTLHATGRRTGIDELSGRSTSYSYDDLYRLTDETITDSQSGNYSASYQYDAVGNRTYSTIDGVRTAYTYDDNDRLTQQGGTRYTYDDNGNTLTETLDTDVVTYGYNAKNELIRVEQGGNTTGYAYNPNGIRISKPEGGATTTYVVDENRDYAQVLLEDDGTAQVSYTYGDDLISQDRDGEAYFYHYDGLGSTRSLTDSQGNLANTYDYEAFGEVLGQTGSVENGYLFAGEQFDSTLDQYYVRARYYNQGLGRFITSDSFAGFVWDPQTLHKYAYNHGDPVNRIDPTGNISLPQIGMGLQIVGTLASIALPTYDAYQNLKAGASLGEVTVQLATEAALGASTSLVAGGVLRYAPNIMRIRPNRLNIPITGRAKNSIWNKGIKARGEEVELRILGGRRTLPWNYPTIDDFSDNIATSIKSMDLTGSSAAGRLRSEILKSARQLNAFKPRNWGSGKIANEAVKGRKLVWAFETGAANKVQAQLLKQVAREVKQQYPNIQLRYAWIQ